MHEPYGGHPPFAEGSTTSEEAADSVAPAAASLRERVYACIDQAGESGLTCDEIEVLTGLAHQTASARCRELVLADRIYATEKVRKTRRGRNAQVYRVTGPRT